MKIYYTFLILLLCSMSSAQVNARECIVATGQDGKGTVRVLFEVIDHTTRVAMKTIGAPADVRGVETREEFIVGKNSWQRTLGKLWVIDAEAAKLKSRKLDELWSKIEPALNNGVILENESRKHDRLISMPTKMKVIIDDNITIKTPAWKVEYNNINKVGRKTINDLPASGMNAGLMMSIAKKIGLKGQIENKVKLKENAGTKRIANYACKVTKVKWPFNGELCEANINGHRIVLHTQINKSHGISYTEKAVKIEPDACIKPDLFDMPNNIKF